MGFKIADEIAARVGIHADSDYRIRSGMLYTLLQASGEGHTYLPREQLFTRCARLLGVDESYMEKHLMDMVIDRKLVLKEKSGETIVYPAQYYYLELNTARMLNELNIVCPEDKELVRHRIELIEKETGTVLVERTNHGSLSQLYRNGKWHLRRASYRKGQIRNNSCPVDPGTMRTYRRYSAQSDTV